MPLSTNIRTRREELLISPNQLAQAADANITDIYDLERGIKLPKLRILVAIADALSVSIDRLLDRNDFIEEVFSPTERFGYNLVRDELQPLSANIRSRREELKFSITDLAFHANEFISTMYDVERGIIIPSIRTLVSIADVLKISIDKLLSRDKNEKIMKSILEKRLSEKYNRENYLSYK